MIAAIPTAVVLAIVCVAAGVVPHTATATVAGAGAAATDQPAGTAAHPPTRDYDLDLPPLIPAASAAPSSGTASPTVSPTASPSAGSPGTGSAATGGPSVVLRATDRRIPARMLTAYHKAESRIAAERPGCHLRWQVLAGIGRVESGHARGRAVTPDGTLTSRILGPALDGLDGRALIRDTDHGRLDADTRYDRAVGAMQFIPTTWVTSGRDGSGDGNADPNNLDDATLAAGGYLCRGGRDLAVPADLHAAIYSYNPSTSYVRAVLAWAAGYTVSGAVAGPTTITAAPLPAGPSSPVPSHVTPAPALALALALAGPSDVEPSPGTDHDAAPTPTGTPPARRPTPSPAAPSRTAQSGDSRTSLPARPRTTGDAATNPPAPAAASPTAPLIVIAMTPADGTGSPRAPTPTP